jgi:acylphosphatase
VSDRVIRRVIVHGRVQGVGYRAFVCSEATRHGIEGWVRNRRDGTVEAVFGGEVPDVAAMIEACRAGPRGARVERVEGSEAMIADMRHVNPAKGFDVRPTE